MAISFDTSGFNAEQSVGLEPTQNFADDPCGENVDWMRGLDALPRARGRTALDATGSLLTKVIERDIIPRLFLAHRQPVTPEKADTKPVDLFAMGDSEAFAKLVLASDPAKIMDQVQRLIDSGVRLQQIYLDLLAPVARRLGVLWEEDRCTFTEVTLGLSHLHQVLRELGRRNGEDMHQQAQKRRACLVPVPGEQHTFGVSVLEEFFLHAGWLTTCDHSATRASIMQTISTQQIDVLGFSVGSDEFLEPLPELIDRARKVSKNKEMAVLIGGNFLLRHPEAAAGITNATIVYDAINAVHTADKLIPQLPAPAAVAKPM